MSDKLIMPRALTAEIGAKHLFSGEFFELSHSPCLECLELGDDEDCDFCFGTGTVSKFVPVSWTTVKDIYALAVKHYGENNEQNNRKDK